MKKTVLIIEDNPANLKLLHDVLAQGGYDVLTATNADDGIVLAKENHPALILMDIQLPGLDGLTAATILKADEGCKHIPIIAVTAYAMQGDETRILSAGCDGYMAKPVRYKDLLMVVHDKLAN